MTDDAAPSAAAGYVTCWFPSSSQACCCLMKSEQPGAYWSIVTARLHNTICLTAAACLPACLVPSPDTRVFRLVVSPFLSGPSTPTLHVFTCCLVPLSGPRVRNRSLNHCRITSSRSHQTNKPSKLLRSHTPPSTSHPPPAFHPRQRATCHPNSIQSIPPNRAVGLPHCHTRRHP
jgi:hypothetical protein